MARILITSGPTRQYLDPVRYLTNASSGKMGLALIEAGLEHGHRLVVVSGPVEVTYPSEIELVPVLTTDEMLHACEELFPDCQGMIGAAAPCDYKPIRPAEQKIAKTGEPLILELHETVDIVARLGKSKRQDQWVVGFALETEDARFRAIVKMEKKHCDMIVSNGPQAMNSDDNDVEILAADGSVLANAKGSKQLVARTIFEHIDRRFGNSDN